MQNNSIREFLARQTLVFDGAMGTYFAQLYGDPSAKCELANINQPERILAIHREYIQAGAGAIKTNTFGANPQMLEEDGALLRRVLRQGWELAAEAAAEATEPPFVFADIGPLPKPTENPAAAYQEVIDCFLELGAQNFLFETFSSAAFLPQLAAYIKSRCPAAFIITSFAVQPDGFSREGQAGSQLIAAVEADPNIDVWGFNCVSGPYHLRQYIKTLARIPQCIIPNAGYPTVINNRTFFGNNPEYFASQLGQIAALGVRVLGGCCGTTPAHIAASVAELQKTVGLAEAAPRQSSPELKLTPLPNRFRAKAEAGQRLLAVELEPPQDTNLPTFMQKARILQQAGVDIITVPDCPIGRARMDSSLLACKLRRELNVDALPHMTCRDRNLNAIKALLLGLSVENVNNVLIVTGDPIPTAERDEIKSVFNFNSRMLAKYISSLNESSLQTPFYICGALNVNALNFNIQLELARQKLANGVSMLLTQPVLSRQALANLRRAHDELPARILAGIMPVVSYRNACFMNNEIAGITVEPELAELYRDKSREEARELAVSTSVAIARAAAACCDGYYLISPFNRVDIICDIISELAKED